MADVSPSLSHLLLVLLFLIKDLVTTVKVIFLALCLTRYFKRIMVQRNVNLAFTHCIECH